jgi:hypothetical protein
MIGLHLHYHIKRHCLLTTGWDDTCIVIFKNKFQSKSNVIPKPALQQVRDLHKIGTNFFKTYLNSKAMLRKHYYSFQLKAK